MPTLRQFGLVLLYVVAAFCAGGVVGPMYATWLNLILAPAFLWAYVVATRGRSGTAIGWVLFATIILPVSVLVAIARPFNTSWFSSAHEVWRAALAGPNLNLAMWLLPVLTAIACAMWLRRTRHAHAP